MRTSCIVLFVVLLSISAFAKDINFKCLGVSDGLVEQSAISIWQDELDRMWFGNTTLNVYDGNTVQMLRLSDYLDGVEDTNIRSIFGDKQGLLYVLAEETVVSYHIPTETFEKKDFLANAICTIDGLLYYSWFNKLYSYNQSNQDIAEVIALPEEAIITVILAHGSDILLGTNKGLFKADRNKKVVRLTPELNVTCLLSDVSSRIILGTRNDGVHILYPDLSMRALKDFHHSENVSVHNRILSLTKDVNNRIWIGSFEGLYLFSNNYVEKVDSYISHQPVKNTNVYGLFTDKQGTIWLGSYSGEIRYFNPEAVYYTFYAAFNNYQTLNDDVIVNMEEDGKGNLYIASKRGGLSVLNLSTQTVKHYQQELANLAENKINSLYFDPESEILYLGTFTDGIYLLDTKSGKIKTLEQKQLVSKTQRYIEGIYPYQKELVILTQAGIYKLNKQTYELSYFFDSPELRALCTDMIWDILFDTMGNLWVSSLENGLFKVNLATEQVTNVPLLLPETNKPIQNGVLEMCIDQQQNLYFVTLSAGVYQYNLSTEKQTVYSEKENLLLCNVCYNMAITQSGKLLVSTSKGISLIDTQKRSAVHSEIGSSFPLKGVGGDGAIYVSPTNKQLYVGGIDGMISFYEDNLLRRNNQYALFLSSLSVNNGSVSPDIKMEKILPYTSHIDLLYNQNNVTFTVASSNYASTHYTRYEYKMEGLDMYWTETTNKKITYTALPPGAYVFNVREVENPEKFVLLHIYVKPPFYASLWAILIYVLLGMVLLSWFIYFSKSKANLRAKLAMEEREKERIEELNQSKLHFFTNISHEFRIPLTLIRTQVDLLIEQQTGAVAIRKHLQKIKKHTGRMQDLISELLDFRKQEQGELKLKVTQVDITEFLQIIYASFSDYARSRHIEYVFEYAPEAIYVWQDSVQMQKVFYNLLSNAFKFTPAGGKITLILQKKTSVVEIHVSNTGSTIKEEDHARIFNIFYQGESVNNDSNLPGSGLGLALTKGVVLLHHGEIALKSENDLTTFSLKLLLGESHFTEKEKTTQTVTLDLSNLLPIEAEAETDEIVLMEQRSFKILIVEDNDELRQLLRDAFATIYEVIEARNGEEGLASAKLNQPDLIVSDIMMPKLSGTEMCVRLKSHMDTSHIPIILLTAQSSEIQMLEGLRSGADDYIVKPFQVEVLRLKCNNLVKTLHELQNRFCHEPSAKVSELTTNILDKELLEKSIEIIEANFANLDFDITQWSKVLGVGRTKVFNKIKTITGLTPNDFIINIKLKKAASVLRLQPELTISEIAYSLGFTSPSYFGKCFKEQFGITPLQYRKGQEQ